MEEPQIKDKAIIMLSDAINWLIKQQQNGSWNGDIRDTCYAIQALVESRYGLYSKRVTKAKKFLIKMQDETGDWNDDDGYTAEAIRTLVLLRESKDSKTNKEWIEGSKRTKNGPCF